MSLLQQLYTLSVSLSRANTDVYEAVCPAHLQRDSMEIRKQIYEMIANEDDRILFCDKGIKLMDDINALLKGLRIVHAPYTLTGQIVRACDSKFKEVSKQVCLFCDVVFLTSVFAAEMHLTPRGSMHSTNRV